MPIRNEASFIARSLGAVLAQDYPPDRMEVLVVDGMSTDGTRDRVKSLMRDRSDDSSPQIKLLDNPKKIVPTALNIGLRHAKGDIIIRVDGHCEIPPDYVRKCVKLLQETEADNVGGLQWSVGENAFAHAVGLATRSPFGAGNAKFRYSSKPSWVDTVYLGAYRREVFERVGGFDEELVRNQDDEFNFRLIQAGGKIWLDPDLKVKYYSRSSLRKLWRQYFQYGLYKVRVIQKRGAVPSWRHIVPTIFVLALFVMVFVSLVTHLAIWGLMVVVPYFLANILASFWTACRDWRALPILPVVFAILHFAYGLGFLWGLWKWRGKWKERANDKPSRGINAH